MHGKPKGSCHARRLSRIADPTIGLQVHPFIIQTAKINLDHVDTDEKENQLLDVSYPRSKEDYDTVSPWEFKAIGVLMTGLSPSLCKGPKREYANAYDRINNYQMDKDIPILPLGLFDLVSPILNPVYVAYSPSTSNIEEYYKKLAVYKEELCLQNIELEVTNG